MDDREPTFQEAWDELSDTVWSIWEPYFVRLYDGLKAGIQMLTRFIQRIRGG